MLGLGFLYRKAQATVDNAIAQLVWSLLVIVPVAVALGFATAAVAEYLHRVYEPVIANLIMAGIFLALAGLAAAGYALRKPETVASEEAKAQEQAARHAEDDTAAALPFFSDADREMLLSALAAAAPFAVRPLLTTAFRNLPIVLLVAAVAFIMTRPGAPPVGANPEPAE
jgi:NhaP-type Na+/H+ or K+/H+ antiporter